MANVKPTDEQIKACLEHFRDIAPKIRQKSFFGDDNREKIEAQIEVLEKPFEWDDDLEYCDAKGLDFDEDYELLSNVRDAIQWINGEYDGDDFPTSWDSLIQ